MAMSFPVFGGTPIIQSRGSPIIDKPGWGPPDMSQQIQGAIASLHKLYTGAEQQQTTKYEQRKAADVLEDIYKNPGRAAAALGQPGGLYGGPGTDTLQPKAPASPQETYARPLKPEIQSAVDATTTKYGLSPTFLSKLVDIESSGNPNAVSSTGATGLTQFTKGTWSKYGQGDRRDINANLDAAARYALDNKRYLESELGRPVTDGELYLAHQQGAGGALALLKNPNARAGDVVNPRNIAVNGGNPNMTAGEFASKWTGKFPGQVAQAMPVDPRTQAAAPINAPQIGPNVAPGPAAPIPAQLAPAAPQATPGPTPGPDQYVPAPEQVRDAQRILSDPNSTPPMKTWATQVVEKAAATTGSVAQADPTQPSPTNPTPITQNSQPLLPVPGVNQPLPQAAQPMPTPGQPIAPGQGGPVPSMAVNAQPPIGMPGSEPQPPAAEVPPPAQAPPPAAAPPPAGAPGGGVPPQAQPQTTGSVGGVQLPPRAAAAAQRLGIDPAMLSGADPRYLLALAHAVRSGDPGMVQAVTGAMTATQKAQGSGDWKVISDGQGGFIRYNERTGETDQSGAGTAAQQAAQIIKPDDKEMRTRFNIDPNDRRSYQVKYDAKGRITSVDPITEERRDPTPDFQQEQQLAKDVEGNPQYKVYQGGVQNLAKLKAGLAQGDPTGDLASIFNFMKSLDPDSTVGPGDKASAETAGGIPSSIWKLWNQALGEGSVSPTLRRQFYNTALATVQGAAPQAKRAVEVARNKASAYNLKPDRVVTWEEMPDDLKKPVTVDKRGRDPFANAGDKVPRGTPQAPVPVKTPQEGEKLPDGSFYALPNGDVFRVDPLEEK
jgi:Transglycosylase SLT domain